MLILKNIIKDYVSGNETVRAMNNISVNFRENEFVSILGASGCGKTTMLNVIGGLDRYDSGDLIIDGKSTKDFTDEDWDTYRNHSIGFIFQSYNLIPHLTVLENVEIALKISGITKEERRKRAIEALEKVGLGDQLHKKPNQISGGQSQRVSISRALVNNPHILIADEPTGALDSSSAEQVMGILKEIAKDKLVVMVTHNPEIAYGYSSRIVKCKDGKIVDDTNPFEPTEEDFKKEEINREEEKKKEKPSMGLFTAFGLSIKNLLTKRGRTFLLCLASSIGILTLSLVLSFSQGIDNYIAKIQSDALLAFPINIEKEAVNTEDLISSFTGLASTGDSSHDLDKVYVNEMMTGLVNSFIASSTSNNLKTFKKYIDDNKEEFEKTCNDIQFKYTVPLNIYRTDTENGPIKVNPSSLMDSFKTNSMMASMEDMMGSMMNTWKEIIGDEELIAQQYDIIYGRLPKEKNEVILCLDKNNEINEFVLYALGLKDQSEFSKNLMNSLAGKEFETSSISSFDYETICNMKFKLLLNYQYMVKDEKTGLWSDRSNNPAYVEKIIDKGLDIKIVGIVRPNKNNAMSVTGCINYLPELMEYAIAETEKSEVVQQQLNNPKVDVITGLEFMDLTVNDFDLADVDFDKINMQYLDFTPFMSMIPEDFDMSQIDIMNIDFSTLIDFGDISDFKKKLMEGLLDDSMVIALKQAYIDTINSTCSYDKTMSTLGYQDKNAPTSIYFYTKSFDDKDHLYELINYYNDKVTEDGHPEYKIIPTDAVSSIFSMVTGVIDIVVLVLIAFCIISLVVSSTMISVLTLNSILTRIREIGILRAIGASKSDIARIFNAETIIIGLVSGVIGVSIAFVLIIPVNLGLDAFTNTGAAAYLAPKTAFILVGISTFLTYIAGLIPSKTAANKNPVDALRTE